MTGRSPVAVNVRIPGPDQTSENGSASSTLPCQPVPWPWTKPCQTAAASLSFMPARSSPRTCSIAAAQISFASRIRSTSCSVLSARATVSTGVASWPPGKASNQPAVNVVGSPTMRSEACVPIVRSTPTRPYSREASTARSSVRIVGGRASSGW